MKRLLIHTLVAIYVAIDYSYFLNSDQNALLFLDEPVASDDVFHHKQSSSHSLADYFKAYRRSGYRSAGSSARGSLASLGMCDNSS